jgi:hypothetical protein
VKIHFWGKALSTRKREFSFLEPANEVPGKKNYKEIMYDKIISEFMESGLPPAKIKPVPNKHPRSIYTSIRKRLKDSNTSADVIIRGEDLFLKRGISKVQQRHEHNET